MYSYSYSTPASAHCTAICTFNQLNTLLVDNKNVEQHNMSFIGTNMISDNNFIDDKDDYEIEDFESLSVASYFVEKLNSDWQDKLLGGLLGD